MSGTDALDRRHMAHALHLAARGLWSTDPNPRVGCVLAQGERIVAEGWHERAGGPHAEAVALALAGDGARGATAYVTLEPCSHHGRTPPCADALIRAGIRRVCYAIRDPNPRVAGGGIARLAAAGITLAGGLLEAEARALNAGFLSRFERGRPWVRVVTEPGDCEPAALQAMRARSSALLTDAGTVCAHDPRLDVVLSGAVRQPLRIVLDPTLAISPAARILAPPGSVLVLTASDDPRRRAALEAAGATVERLATAGAAPDFSALLGRLAERGVNELQVEADRSLSAALIDAGLADEQLRPARLDKGG